VPSRNVKIGNGHDGPDGHDGHGDASSADTDA